MKAPPVRRAVPKPKPIGTTVAAATEPVPSLPGVVQHTRDSLVKEARRLVSLEIPALTLFGVPLLKDPLGSAAWDDHGIVQVALRDLRAESLGRPVSVASTRAGHIPGTHRVGFDSAVDQVVLERFPEHFRGPAPLERILFRIIPTEITRFNEYRAGQLDLSDIPTGHCQSAQRDPQLRGDVAIWPTLGTHAVRFNVERAPFTDARVRRAIAHAIDPSIIVDRLLEVEFTRRNDIAVALPASCQRAYAAAMKR